jgi:hypothetical protein
MPPGGVPYTQTAAYKLQQKKEERLAAKVAQDKLKAKAMAKSKAKAKASPKSKALSFGKRKKPEQVVADAEASDGDEQMGAEEKRAAQSNMVTSLKRGTTPQQKQTLSLYQSLGRNDPEKAKLLQKWLADKKCEFITGYVMIRSAESTAENSSVKGFGSECQP